MSLQLAMVANGHFTIKPFFNMSSIQIVYWVSYHISWII